MPGLALPDCGGSWIADTGGGEGGSLPPGVVEQLTIFGRNGVVISGVVTWIQAQLGTHGPEIWKSMAERCFSEDEVTAAKEALKNAKGEVLKELVQDFKVKRKGAGKKVAEIDDIKKALLALEAAKDMPLILATSLQMTRCPQSWGVPDNATNQDVMGKYSASTWWSRTPAASTCPENSSSAKTAAGTVREITKKYMHWVYKSKGRRDR